MKRKDALRPDWPRDANYHDGGIIGGNSERGRSAMVKYLLLRRQQLLTRRSSAWHWKLFRIGLALLVVFAALAWMMTQ